MEATERNKKIVKDIINVLAENNCTVAQSKAILHYVTCAVEDHSTVQKAEE